MIRTYLFGCHEHIEHFRTFTVNVALPDHKADASTAQKAALSKAQEVAGKEGLSNPTLIHESGVADIKIILEKGAVVAVYCRNADIPPAVSVIDLDYSMNPEADGSKLHAKLMEGRFELLPHAAE